jgi:hypothetical protein
MRQQTIEKDEQGASLAMLDMANVYSLVQAQEARRELPPPDLERHKLGTAVAALTLSRLSAPPLALELLPLQERQLPARMPKLNPLGSQPCAVSLRQLDRKTYQVLMAPHGTTNAVTLDVPAGLPRIINVATLKAMLGANSRDVAFRKAAGEDRRAICPDDYPVDLEDRTQFFKIRQWAILS